MMTTRFQLSPHQHGSLFILLASVLWGTTGAAATLVPEVSPLAVGAFSMGIGGLIQAFLANTALKRNASRLKHHRKEVLIGALALMVYPMAFYTSMRMAGVATGTVVSIASAPLFTLLFECLFSTKRNLNNRKWVSLGLGVVGIVLLVNAESTHGHAQPQFKLWGILLGLVAGLSYATYSLMAKDLINKGVQSQAAMGAIFGLGACLLLPTLLASGDNLFVSQTNTLVLIYMAVIPMGVGYIMFGVGLRHINASTANILTLFEPVVAAVIAVLILEVYIPPIGWFGIALIMVCLFFQSTARAD
ncbi:EamA family transporter (plasmid) [Vibrio pelagius]|uniref:EamA family transporter n=1 Tax=Vibrio pelagius TaxID=28169 RepID=A0ABY5GAQ4_VIBPE|nr:EamA family transporter [Vibrio pelagius]UTT87257.1 EamA family transporter [Vibrio pelagius]